MQGKRSNRLGHRRDPKYWTVWWKYWKIICLVWKLSSICLAVCIRIRLWLSVNKYNIQLTEIIRTYKMSFKIKYYSVAIWQQRWQDQETCIFQLWDISFACSRLNLLYLWQTMCRWQSKISFWYLIKPNNNLNHQMIESCVWFNIRFNFCNIHNVSQTVLL